MQDKTSCEWERSTTTNYDEVRTFMAQASKGFRSSQYLGFIATTQQFPISANLQARGRHTVTLDRKGLEIKGKGRYVIQIQRLEAPLRKCFTKSYLEGVVREEELVLPHLRSEKSTKGPSEQDWLMQRSSRWNGLISYVVIERKREYSNKQQS